MKTPTSKTFTPDLRQLEFRDFGVFLPLEDGDKALVIKVYDGDTLTVGFRHGGSQRPVKESIRIRGIDTPEIRTKSEREKELALLARARLEKVTLGKVVTVVSPESDKYGRLLCDLKTESGDIGDIDDIGNIEIESISDYMLQDSDICRAYDGGPRQPW